MEWDDWIISPREKERETRRGPRTKNQGISTFRNYLFLYFLYPQEIERIAIEVGRT